MNPRIYLVLPDDLPAEFPSSEIIERSLEVLLDYYESLNHVTCEISVSIVSDEEIRELNRDFRQKDKSTDVLSFPMLADDDFPSPSETVMLGDIVISFETCKVQAETIGHSVKDEFARLLVHGYLHLLGYDHEISEEEELIMKKKEDEMLELLGKEGL